MCLVIVVLHEATEGSLEVERLFTCGTFRARRGSRFIRKTSHLAERTFRRACLVSELSNSTRNALFDRSEIAVRPISTYRTGLARVAARGIGEISRRTAEARYGSNFRRVLSMRALFARRFAFDVVVRSHLAVKALVHTRCRVPRVEFSHWAFQTFKIAQSF